MKDLTGKKFNHLTALVPLAAREPTNGTVMWLCKCDCGGTHMVNSNNLQRGRVKSCGCLSRRNYE